ncbi:MAG: GRAM domain-containing protein [Negativicutes bacterium]|nr:GRAM domain-containing protein [Negativicutes bacterium]
MYSFPLEKNESIIKKSMATIQKDENTSIGALYLTNERLVFVGYMGPAVTSLWWLEVPLEHIDRLAPDKTFYLLDNVIDIDTIRGDAVKIIVRDRDSWLNAIKEQTEKL